ncbi:MAG: TIM barrel protein [bacterium]|nr:TIM barrel protein [bacterium]
MQHTLPLIGAAMRLNELAEFADWLAADQRDLEIQDPAYPGYLDQDWRAEAQHGKALLDDKGYTGRLGIHAAFEGIELSTFDKKLRAVIQERYLESLDFGAVVGATHMVIHSPLMAFGTAFANFANPLILNMVIENVHLALEKVLPVAQSMGCALVIECIADKNPGPLTTLVKSFNSDFVRLSVDTGHAALMEAQGGTSPQDWLAHVGDLLGHVHLQDLDYHADRHWALGDGNLNWFAFFRALKNITSQPRLVLEMNDKADIMRSMAWLERHQLGR